MLSAAITLAAGAALAQRPYPSKPIRIIVAFPPGAATHLLTEFFSMTTRTTMQHIPYKGGGPAIIDLLGGQVLVVLNVPAYFVQHAKRGKVVKTENVKLSN